MAETELLLRAGDAAETAGDFARARVLFEQAAALDDPTAWLRLGLLHDYGFGVAVDKTEAMRCYRRAWRQRDTAAANNIAVLYRERGDWRAMFRWYVRCAEAGDGDAWVDVARCYRDGLGVRRSPGGMVRGLAAALASAHISEAGREEAQEMMDAARPRAV